MSETEPSESRVGLRKLLELSAELQPIVTIGPSPSGEIRLIPIVGGTFSGDDLNGVIVPGGADWQQVRSDGGLEISARYLLKTDRDELIEVRSDGLRVASADVLARLSRGERLPANSYYFRTAMRFRTAAARLSHLNDRLAVGYGSRRAATVLIESYEVL